MPPAFLIGKIQQSNVVALIPRRFFMQNFVATGASCPMKLTTKLITKLTTEEVRHVAELAKLTLTEAEIAQYTEQLSAILDYAARLQEVDTSGVPPTPYVLPLSNVMREDEAAPSLSNAAALANAPDSDNRFFRVRAVFEE